MMYLQREEVSINLFNDWCQQEGEDIHTVIKNLTWKGILRYGFQLVNSIINIS